MSKAMPSKFVGKHRRNAVFERCYDYINDCDFSQLDAIMLAFFVLFVGCGTLVLLFVVGGIQSLTMPRTTTQYAVSRHLPPAAASVLVSEERFGRPRQDATPFTYEQVQHPGQVQASTVSISTY